MNGILYGVGVGPGDPELMTIKAIKTINSCDIIAFPGTSSDNCISLQIASNIIPNLNNKKLLPIDMPMSKDSSLLQSKHEAGAKQIVSYLKQGKNIAFLTLGDPCIYSTYLYIHDLVTKMGFSTEIVNGIPSFCAVSAKLSTSLVNKQEQLHIIPASYPIKDALALPGTKVLMKSGSALKSVKEELKNYNVSVKMVENCGLANEHIYIGLNELPDTSSYYSLIIVQEND